MYAIKTEGLCKRYKSVTALDGLNLEIPAGELFALLGVNGAGKTTAVKLLTGLAAPTDGNACVNGWSVTKQPEQVKAVIGVSPQETALAPNLTAEENLALICGVYGFSKPDTAHRIREISERLGLEPVLHRRAGTLSGGWQRRLSIAMALVCRPRVLFLDEPTLGLDVLARRDLWDTIRTLKGESTILLTTHYMEEAAALADRIGIMKNGRLLALGTLGELLAQTGTSDLEAAFVATVKEAAV